MSSYYQVFSGIALKLILHNTGSSVHPKYYSSLALIINTISTEIHFIPF